MRKIWRGNFLGGEPIRRTEVEVRVSKLKNEKATGKDEMTGELIKAVDRVVNWIWRLCNMAFESGVVPEEWRSVVIVPLYKGKGERIECKNYRGINLSVVGKIFADICFIDDEHRGFRAGRGVCRLDLHTKTDR